MHLFTRLFTAVILLFLSATLQGQVIYNHDFGTTTISTHPYTGAPVTLNPNLSGSSWSNSTNAWTSFTGSAGQAIALNNSGGTPTITLTFQVAAGFQVSITSFSFWRQRSPTGAQNWSMFINGIGAGAGTAPTSGSNTGTISVTNPVNNLTGTVTVVLSLSGATGSGTFRMDDFTLNGTVTSSSCTAPSTQASNITFASVGTTSLNVNWTNGNGGGRVVKMNTTNSFAIPTNGSNPTASTVYSGSGEQVIYNGTGSGPVAVTGLDDSTTYFFRVYEFCTPTRNYQTATATNNPNSVQTLANSSFSISTTPATYGPFCNGTTNSISIAYATAGPFLGTYTAQLSNASGSFASPTNIGSGASPITATLPAGVTVGTGYRVRVVNSNPAIAGTDNGSDITIQASPSIPTATTPTPVCIGNTTNIVATGSTGATAYSFWTASSGGNAVTLATTPAGSVSGNTLTTPAGLAAGSYIYYIQGENATCNSATRQAVTVTVNALPTVNIGNDTAYCAGTAFNLTLNAQNSGSTYNWNNGAASTQTFNATTAGNYKVTVTNGNGCVNSDSITVTENVLPVLNLGNDTAYCAGTAFSLTLDAQNSGATYDWNNGAASTQTINANTAGTYTVTVTGTNGCENTDNLVVTENALPVLNLGNDTAYCAGTAFSLTLDAQNSGASYDWNNGTATTQTINATTAGTYTVTVTDANGCENTDNMTVTENALPVVSLGNDTAYCIGTTFSITLDAGNAGASYDWNNGSANTQTFEATEATTYTVNVTDANGCVGTDNLTVTENTLPTVSLGNDTAYCAGTAFSLTLDAQNSGASYDWNNGTATTQTINVSTAGTYSVIVTDANGCINTDELTVTENATPVLNLGNDTAYCAGTAFSLTLDAQNSGASYDWNNGAASTQTFNATADGTYTVTVTGANGCENTDELTVTENALPTVDIEDNTFYCTGTAFSLLLDAGNAGASYSWNGGTSTGQTFTATTAGTYTVTITDANGCVNGDSTVIDEKPLPVVNLGNDTAYCANTAFSLTLNAGNAGASYSWNGGQATTQTFTVTDAGTYTVNVTDVFGCTNSASIDITENALPAINLGNDITTTQTGTVLNAGSGFSSYLWTPGGQTTQQITATQTGNYSVTVSNANGCSASDTVHVTVGSTSVQEVGGTVVAVQVYPNPANEKLNLSLDYQGALQLDLISLNGTVVWSQKVGAYQANQPVEISVDQLQPGIYIIRYTGKDVRGNQKVIVQH